MILDDFIPCTKDKKPAFSKANGPEGWVMMLEKAYAKVYGAYDKIEAGITSHALRDLTGAPGNYLKNDATKPDLSW